VPRRPAWQCLAPGRWECWASGATACRTDYGWWVQFQGEPGGLRARTLREARALVRHHDCEETRRGRERVESVRRLPGLVPEEE
jgi:hypothetical protein